MTYQEYCKQNPVYKASLITKRIAGKLAKVTLAIIVAIICYKGIVFAQNTKVDATVYKTKGDTVTFEIPNGNLYVWETENASEYIVGTTYEIWMFDMETANPYDDIITKVIGIKGE